MQGASHEDANIIFGTVIDDNLGDEVRITVIAAGFDRWDEKTGREGRRAAPAEAQGGQGPGDERAPRPSGRPDRRPERPERLERGERPERGDRPERPTRRSDLFAEDDGRGGDDEFDVPSFLK